MVAMVLLSARASWICCFVALIFYSSDGATRPVVFYSSTESSFFVRDGDNQLDTVKTAERPSFVAVNQLDSIKSAPTVALETNTPPMVDLTPRKTVPETLPRPILGNTDRLMLPEDTEPNGIEHFVDTLQRHRKRNPKVSAHVPTLI